MTRQVSAFTHDWIWQAIDTLALRQGVSASALARLAGLDPTTFNRSKRFTLEGRPRWPSTESIAKLLEATGTKLDEFATLELGTEPMATVEAELETLSSVPLVGEIRDATVGGMASDPIPLAAWRRRPRRAADTGNARFAIAVADNSLEPVYSQGNTLIVSVDEATRTGDRVVVKPIGCQALPRVLLRATRSRIELGAFQSNSDRLELPRAEVDWIARIIWVRQ